jgi:hypothetical protein
MENLPNTSATGYFKRIWLQIIADGFKWGRDMVMGTIIAALNLGLMIHYHLLSEAEWTTHKRLWIISIVLPYVVVFGAHLLWKFFTAPLKIHNEQQKAIKEQNEKHDEAVRLQSELHAKELAERDSKIAAMLLPERAPQLSIEYEYRFQPGISWNRLRGEWSRDDERRDEEEMNKPFKIVNANPESPASNIQIDDINVHGYTVKFTPIPMSSVQKCGVSTATVYKGEDAVQHPWVHVIGITLVSPQITVARVYERDERLKKDGTDIGMEERVPLTVSFRDKYERRFEASFEIVCNHNEISVPCILPKAPPRELS